MKKEKKSETIQIHLSTIKVHEKNMYKKIVEESEKLGISKSSYVKNILLKTIKVDYIDNNKGKDFYEAKEEVDISDARKTDILKGLQSLKKNTN